MAVAFDATANANGNGVTSLSFSHTCTGSDLCLVVGSGSSSPGTITALTYAGAALTLIGALTSSNTFQRVEQWRRIAPATGANTVAVTYDVANQCVAGSISFTGVDQATPVAGYASATGLSTTPSVTVTSAVGNMVVDATVIDDGTAVTPGAGQTERWDVQAGAIGVRGSGSTEAGAVSVVMDWTSLSVDWTTNGCSVQAAANVRPRTLTTLGVGV